MLRRLIKHRKLIPYCVEALFYFAFCRAIVCCTSSGFYARFLGEPNCETLHNVSLSAQQYQTIVIIQTVLRVMPKYLPWKSACLDQAMVAQKLLKRRGLSTTVYVGFTHDSYRNFIGHAWARCGRCWIVGYQPSVDYKVACSYALL